MSGSFMLFEAPPLLARGRSNMAPALEVPTSNEKKGSQHDVASLVVPSSTGCNGSGQIFEKAR